MFHTGIAGYVSPKVKPHELLRQRHSLLEPTQIPGAVAPRITGVFLKDDVCIGGLSIYLAGNNKHKVLPQYFVVLAIGIPSCGV